jgi:catalase
MHTRGSGAFGTFTVTHDITQYTKGKIFSKIGKKTEKDLTASKHRQIQQRTQGEQGER